MSTTIEWLPASDNACELLPGVDNYAQVDEPHAAPDSDDYVGSEYGMALYGADGFDSYTIAGSSLPAGATNIALEVVAWMMATDDGGGPGYNSFVDVSVNSMIGEDSLTIATGPVLHQFDWTAITSGAQDINPITDEPWTLAEVNALLSNAELAIEANSIESGVACVAQASVLVTYDAPSGASRVIVCD